MIKKLFLLATITATSTFAHADVGGSYASHLFNHKKHYANWITASYGRIPKYAIIGGYDGDGKPLYICRAKYEGGIQPGKIVGENCNFSFNGIEVMTPIYQVLISQSGFKWAPGNDAFTPKDAISGGYQNKQHLYICQGKFDGGIYPGKIVGHRCEISHAGAEVALEFYNVLVG